MVAGRSRQEVPPTCVTCADGTYTLLHPARPSRSPRSRSSKNMKYDGSNPPTASNASRRSTRHAPDSHPAARELPSLTQGAGHALFGRIWPGNPWTRAYQRRQQQAGTERAAGWLSGACLVLRREAFEAVGGFDPSYFMFFEDLDLGERLGRAGWSNVY